MKVHGFCTVCHKIKRVDVRPYDLALNRLQGVCDDCARTPPAKRHLL